MVIHKPLSVWFTGLPGSGKSTLADALTLVLKGYNYPTILLDADVVRKGFNSDLGYSLDDRKENIRRIAELSKILIEQEIFGIQAFICPTNELRNMAREIVGFNNFFLIYLSTPLEICEQRDPKGMYAKARAGSMSQFTGISQEFEVPDTAHITLDTSIFTIEECIQSIMERIGRFN